MATPAIGEPLELRSKSFEILGVFRGTAQRMKQRLCAEPLKTYCFGSEQATSDFLKDPEGNLAKAQAYYQSKHPG